MKKLIIFLILIISLIFLYGKYIEPNNFKIKEYSVIDTNIPESFNGYKIIHLTDLYYENKDLTSIIDKINNLNPDLVIFTGNLLHDNFNPDQKETLINYLNSIKSTYGIYAVKGNNDNNEIYNEIINSTNIKILNNEYIYLYNNNYTPILLIGLDTNINLENAFKYEDNNNYKIVLSHYPDNFKLINDKNINLFLSGNSLNGQVRLPFLGGIIKKDGSKKYYDEKYYINNTNIFISNGLGNPKYDIRLLNTPSINFYRLYSK